MCTQSVKEVARISLGGVSTPIYQIIKQTKHKNTKGEVAVIQESKVSDYVLRCSHVYIAVKRSFLTEKKVCELFNDVIMFEEQGYTGVESIKEFCKKRGLAHIGARLEFAFETLCEEPLKCIGNIFLTASKTLLIWGNELNPQIRVKDLEGLFGTSFENLGCLGVYECVKFEYKNGEFKKEETGNKFIDKFVDAEQVLRMFNGCSTLEIALRGELSRVIFNTKSALNGAREMEELERNERLELLFDRYSKQEITEALKAAGSSSVILQALNNALFNVQDVEFEECK